MSFNLIKATDEWMCRKQFHLPRNKSFYPSEASVKWTDMHGIERTAGACMRAVWYRLTGKGISSGTSPYSEWIFALGKAVEEILVEQWKQMGILVANNVKFFDPERNISGEVDVVLKDPNTGKIFVGEVKSFYSYAATKQICGNAQQVGQPKTSQLLQALIYTDLGRKLNLFDYVKLVYYARDSANRAEFDITLFDNKGDLYPVINGLTDHRFHMENIYERYSELAWHINKNIMPAQDYQSVWSSERVEQMNSINEVAKTTYAKWKKNPKSNPIGDWMCSYCNFFKQCANQ